MGILLSRDSRLIIQGITGVNGRNLAGCLLASGSPVVGGVTPGRRGERVQALPVFGSCYEAVQDAGATASLISVPAPFALDACLEAIDAGIGLIVVYTEGVPIADAMRMAAFARARGSVVVGPNAAGCVSPRVANLSDINEANLDPGRIGIVSKSGTLACEVIDGLRRLGLGESTVVCLGGDLVPATTHPEILERFEADTETDAVVLIGEIGGRAEMAAADVVARMRTPVVACIVGRSAPPGKRMGHAGALLGSAGDGAAAKIARLQQAGARIAPEITDVAAMVAAAVGS